jgi:outer membrane protein assembly factor BamA
MTQQAVNEGYLEASAEVTAVRSDSIFIHLNRGERYYVQSSQYDELYSADSTSILAVQRSLLESFENNGYPFAVAHLTAYLLNDSILAFRPEIEKGPRIVFDSLVIRSEKPFSDAYFQQYLQIVPGRDYDESLLRKSARKISELPFARNQQAPRVVFREGKASVYLYLEDRPANRFDGVVGFQPDAATGRIVLTGDVDLSLHNALRRGEQISLRWRRLQESTQSLFAAAALPYLLQTRWGLWGEVDIYRRDSTFATTQLEASAGYLLGADRYLRAFAERWTSNALSGSVENVDDIAITRYGIKFKSFSLDYAPNPRKGYYLETETSAGAKTLTVGEEDPVTTEHDQFELQIRSNFYLPISGRFGLSFRADGGTKLDTTLRLNEHYRIGGLNSIRGFDEESIFASSFGIGTVEVRYLLDRASTVFLFFDQGWFERTAGDYRSDTPFGFGAGALIGTENGAFRLVYALGSQQNNPILLRNGKIHFGFVNRF